MKSLPEDLALLQRCGEALWGYNWRPGLRAELHINPMTTRRWMSGEQIVPRGVWEKLARLMSERGTRLHQLSLEVDRNLDSDVN